MAESAPLLLSSSSNSGGVVMALVIMATSLPLLAWLVWHRFYSSPLLPPGPSPLPLLGNLLELTKTKLIHQHLARLAREEYGPIMYLQLGYQSVIVASSGEVAREFLLTYDKVFATRPPMVATDLLQYGLENGFILGPYGPRWRESRKLTSLHLFSPRSIAAKQHVRKEELLLLLRNLHKRAHSEVNLTAAISDMVENTVCRVLVSRRRSDMFPSSDGEQVSVLKLMHEASRLFQLPVYSDYIPFLGFLDRKTKRSFSKFRAKLDPVWDWVMAERRKDRQQQLCEQKKIWPDEDMLDVILSNYSSHVEAAKTCLIDLFAASLDTISVSLDWAMAELLNNPFILKKLQQEVENIVGTDRLVEEDDLASLPYLKAIVKETLRLHTPAPLALPHMAMDTCHIMGGQYRVPKGTRVLFNLWAIGRDPKVWSDPDLFLPERFLNVGDTNDALRIDVHGQQFDMIPFGSGRRSCPGMPMAMPTLHLVVGNLAHCFNWQVHGAIDMLEKPGTAIGRWEPLLATPIPRLNIVLGEPACPVTARCEES